jgi:hypothetical protein
LSQYYSFGPTKIARIKNSGELKKVLDDPSFKSETIIIKPNWVDTEPGGFIESRTLRMIFEALDSNIIVTESYNLARAKGRDKNKVTLPNEDRVVNWKWFLGGEGWRWLFEHPSWDWFKNTENWEILRKEEKTFLDQYGFTDLFQEFDVEYVNATEEIWAGRNANPTEIMNEVESHFAKVQSDKLYEIVPKTLYHYRGSTFISLARIKQYATFSLKNMFGMIVDPMRSWWHGPNNSRIVQSIVDINKIYHALFKMYGLCESIHQIAVPDPDGDYKALYMEDYSLHDGLGIIATANDLVALDSLILELTKDWISISEKTNKLPIIHAMESKIGSIDTKDIEDAKKQIGKWFIP